MLYLLLFEYQIIENIGYHQPYPSIKVKGEQYKYHHHSYVFKALL